MYIAIIAILLGLGSLLVARGARRGRMGGVVLGALVVAATLALFGVMEIWGEALWFEALGYGERFWIEVVARVVAAAAGGLVAGLLSWLLVRPFRGMGGRYRWLPLLGGALGGVVWGLAQWNEVLLFLNRVEGGLREPLLGRDVGFYLFVLPLLDGLVALAGWVAAVVAVTALAVAVDWQDHRGLRVVTSGAPPGGRPLLVAAATIGVVLAAWKAVDVFHLLQSPWGVVAGPGWTDVHVRLPAFILVSLATLGVALSFLVPRTSVRFFRRFGGRLDGAGEAGAVLLGIGRRAAWLAGFWILALVVAPGLVQWLLVEPNEITYEAPYIERNIQFTRHGFRLHEVEDRDFPVEEAFTRELAAENAHLLREVRLWDWRVLLQVYDQFQEIRLYYEFTDVDVDRYVVDGQYRLMMVSAREMDPGNLPQRSQTFVNKRFKYTHGFGLTMTAVADFTPEGLPDLLVRDIPPVSRYPALEVTEPRIYYGEITDEHVVVNSSEPEFDYPQGEENAYIQYPGRGGVQLSSFWRRFLFGWKFDGTRLLVSGYPRPESRIQFHRQIRDRVRTLAPFLRLDQDPYVVLSEGRIYWVIDAYTASTEYPYSEPYSALEILDMGDGRQRLATGTAAALHGVNYVRNSVKAVVDAFDGRVDLYVFDPDDPLVQAWDRVYPGLLQPRASMPEDLERHVRYPEDFLLVQGLVYARYHMTDPAVFYNQEDLWVRATEKYREAVQPVEPYYIMWEPPGSDEAQFVLILPFTPKNRQVLIGWIAGMCDPPDYGRFIAYQFPKDRRVLGPQQVETKIDQDPWLSARLSLWDQRGSNVIRGNVLAIPIGDTVLYVEPIYLQAETAAYPELRLVALMEGDQLAYAESFDAALEVLLGAQPDLPPEEAEAAAAAVPLGLEAQARQAEAALEAYLRALGEGRFRESGEHLETLQQVLGRMGGDGGEPEEPALPEDVLGE